ncbi:hypothetical protein J437_LFUL018321 [Ladona fulva]|uniref:BED-type domain-containing protein n=1 Tax=Ladona fulva TaxID=123851 RepID=A0A8K0KPA1_LADFU|nr:hypothetical protein J437_LFUL018321 [Ladona fulva]
MDSKRKRSEIWRYFCQVSNDQAECQFCRQRYSFETGGASNLFRHIKIKHPSISWDNNVPKRACHLLNERTTSIASQVTSQSNSTTENFQSTPSESTTQRTLNRFIHRPLGVKTSQLIDETLLKFLISQYLPFSLVEQPAFKTFIRSLNPKYQLPRPWQTVTVFEDSQ